MKNNNNEINFFDLTINKEEMEKSLVKKRKSNEKEFKDSFEDFSILNEEEEIEEIEEIKPKSTPVKKKN
jgi:hypothetical protein